MRLDFVAYARAQRQVLARADVVLDVERGLEISVGEVRVADSPRIVARLIGLIRRETVEGVRAQIVGRRIGPKPAAVEDEAHAPRALAAHVVQIGSEVQATRVLAAGQLRAAGRERVVDAGGRCLRGRDRIAVGPEQLQPRSPEGAAPKRAEMLRADVVCAVLGRVGAFDLVKAADALVLVGEAAQVVGEADRLVERQGVVHLPVHEQVVARRPDRQRLGARAAARQHDVQVRRVVRAGPEGVDVERALVLDETAAHPETVVDVALGSSDRHERAAAAQPAVAHAEVREVADRSDPGLRDDLDRHAARAVEFRRELIARDADRSDLRLRRQRAALEPVDPDDRARAGHLLQLLLQLHRIVRQRFDLFAGERRAERVAARIGGGLLLVLPDGHRCFHLFDGEYGDLFVLAGADPHVFHDPRLEARELRLDRVAAGRQRQRRDAGFRRERRIDGRRMRRLVSAGRRHLRADDHAAAGVDDGDAEEGGRRRLSERARRRQREPEHEHTHHDFGASNLRGSIFALIRIRSKVVSSIVSPATARRIRNGSFSPSTSR